MNPANSKAYRFLDFGDPGAVAGMTVGGCRPGPLTPWHTKRKIPRKGGIFRFKWL